MSLIVHSFLEYFLERSLKDFSSASLPYTVSFLNQECHLLVDLEIVAITRDFTAFRSECSEKYFFED